MKKEKGSVRPDSASARTIKAADAEVDAWAETRASLLLRLRDVSDDASWREFFETYGRVVFHFTMRSGLAAPDAEDVVQETMMAAARHLPTFRYDPGKGSFKSWMLAITRSKITDRFRKGRRSVPIEVVRGSGDATDSATSAADRVPDPGSVAPDEAWDRQWLAAGIEAALQRVKASVDLKHFQVYDCFVNKGWSARQTAEVLGVKSEQVYVIKHRIEARLAEELKALEREWR